MDDDATYDDEADPCPLILRHLDRQTTPVEDARLTELLRDDPEARRIFVELCHDGGLLREWHRPAVNRTLLPPPPSFPFWRNLAVVALAAGLVAAIIIRLDSASAPAPTVAVITGVDNCRWTEPVPEPGVGLPARTRLDLVAGLAEITCSNGARLVLRGPACLVLDAANSATLRHGAITATVDGPGSAGFDLHVPGGRVIDRGTAFGVEVGTDGASRVTTFQGLVEVSGTGGTTRVAPGRELSLSAAGRIGGDIPAGDGFVRTLPSPAIGLVAHWPLCGGYLDDVVVPIGTTVLEGGPARWDGPSLHLDGRQHLLVTHTRKLDLTGSLTIAAWIRTTAPVGDIVSKYDWHGKQRSFAFGLGAQRDPRHHRPGHLYAWVSSRAEEWAGATICSSQPVNDDSWHHVAVTFAAGHSLELFVDGRRDDGARLTGAVPGTIAISPRHLAIGAGYREADRPNDYRFDGNLADVRIYCISTADIAALAAAPPTTGTNTPKN